jgi:Sec-independent protein translocase protein TatA
MQHFFGLFNLGGGEIILVLALPFILFGAEKLPDLAKGLGDGLLKVRKTAEDEATDAGRSLGGIYGKPATEALTHDNQVAELYNPGVLQKDSKPHNRSNALLSLFRRFVVRLRRLLRPKRSAS